MKSLFGTVIVCTTVAGGIFAVPVAAGQTSTAAGVYTDAQSSRGEALYADNCSYCHLNDLSGGELAPPLIGPTFVGSWSGRNLGELFDYMRAAMPLNSPGGLSAAQNADLLAFILSRTGYPVGSEDLPADSDSLTAISLAARP